MIFLHNGGGFWQIWKNQISHFEVTHRVIAIDWIGFGSSSEAEEPLTLEFYYRTLRHFVSRLNIHDFILVGNCIGASVAVKYKQLHPKEVSHLILMNICPGIRMVRSRIMRMLLFKEIRDGWDKKMLKKVIRFAFTRTMLKGAFPRVLFGKTYDPEDPLAQMYRVKFKQNRQTAARSNLLFASDTFTMEQLRNPRIDLGKSILLWGSHNKVAGLKKEGYYHQRKIGLERLFIIQDAGHLACYESAEKVNELIRNHINA